MRNKLAALVLCVSCFFPAVASARGPVTTWTLLADSYGRGYANWRTLAIMHLAMHDALNAALPLYARWAPAEPDEPRASDALPQAAMAAAAREVLLRLHPDRSGETDRVFGGAIGVLPPGPERESGVKLGSSIGAAWVRRRQNDGWSDVHPFRKGNQTGQWRPTPLEFESGRTTSARPFLFPSSAAFLSDAPPPPPANSPRFLRDCDEARRLGGEDSTERTPPQTAEAAFWAYQSSQRGFMRLGADLLETHPRPDGIFGEARFMAKLAAAMADSAILVWAEKEKFDFWRPVTAIAEGACGAADPGWRPLIDTPDFPEYPSGHSSDCLTGAGVIEGAIPERHGVITYYALAGPSIPDADMGRGMGQHAQVSDPAARIAGFESPRRAAETCVMSRIWAGAHFRSANEESARVSALIVRAALNAVPPLGRR